MTCTGVMTARSHDVKRDRVQRPMMDDDGADDDLDDAEQVLTTADWSLRRNTPTGLILHLLDKTKKDLGLDEDDKR